MKIRVETQLQEVTNLTDWLHIDNEAPRAVIKDYDTTKYSDAFESLSFNMFKNEIYTAEISVSDTSGDSVEGSGLHNTTTQKYCVYEMGTDETALKLDKDAVKSIIEKVDSGQEQSWSKLEFDKNGKDEITVGKAKDKEAAENNYLILVKTIDNTGNEAVYASNGIVVDVTSPKVECTFDTSKDGGYVSEKDGILCYQGDAKYELKIEDPEEYFSSISKLEVIVSKDGETITPTTKEFDADETYEDSYIIEWPTSESGFSYEELKNKSSIVVKGVVSANKGTINGVGTNKSKIKIKAYDTAGNVSETIEQQLAFDTKAPEISVSFENKNGDPITQKDEFSYYQDTTVMVIKYTDRNFPVGEEYKDNLYFILKREEDDQERKVMLEGLEKEGITYEIEDEEGKNSFENYTDNRVVTVKLTFDDQDKYEIKPYCVDMFGNEGTTEETYKFAVDTEAPVIEYTYEYLDADNKWKPAKDGMPEIVRLDSISQLFRNFPGKASLAELNAISSSKVAPITDEERVYVELSTGSLLIRVETDASGNIISDKAWNEIILKEANENRSENGTLNGVVIDAMTGEGVPAAKLEFKAKENAENSTHVTSGKDGSFSIELAADVYEVTISADGYVDETFEFEMEKDKNYSGEQFTISPELAAGSARIVLEWNAQHQDLDSYLWGNTDKGDDLYVNFRKRTCEGRDGLLAELDVDDTNGYGPETITLNDLNGVYTYSVVDYRTTGTLQQYGATVKVYLPGKSAPTVITLDPNAGVENVWEVFELDHGELKILNRAPAEENLRPGSK